MLASRTNLSLGARVRGVGTLLLTTVFLFFSLSSFAKAQVLPRARWESSQKESEKGTFTTIEYGSWDGNHAQYDNPSFEITGAYDVGVVGVTGIVINLPITTLNGHAILSETGTISIAKAGSYTHTASDTDPAGIEINGGTSLSIEGGSVSVSGATDAVYGMFFGSTATNSPLISLSSGTQITAENDLSALAADATGVIGIGGGAGTGKFDITIDLPVTKGETASVAIDVKALNGAGVVAYQVAAGIYSPYQRGITIGGGAMDVTVAGAGTVKADTLGTVGIGIGNLARSGASKPRLTLGTEKTPFSGNISVEAEDGNAYGLFNDASGGGITAYLDDAAIVVSSQKAVVTEPSEFEFAICSSGSAMDNIYFTGDNTLRGLVALGADSDSIYEDTITVAKEASVVIKGGRFYLNGNDTMNVYGTIKDEQTASHTNTIVLGANPDGSAAIAGKINLFDGAVLDTSSKGGQYGSAIKVWETATNLSDDAINLYGGSTIRATEAAVFTEHADGAQINLLNTSEKKRVEIAIKSSTKTDIIAGFKSDRELTITDGYVDLYVENKLTTSNNGSGNPCHAFGVYTFDETPATPGAIAEKVYLGSSQGTGLSGTITALGKNVSVGNNYAAAVYSTGGIEAYFGDIELIGGTDTTSADGWAILSDDNGEDYQDKVVFKGNTTIVGQIELQGGDDLLAFDLAKYKKLSITGTVDLGAGTDTLRFGGASVIGGTSLNQFSNFEVLQMRDTAEMQLQKGERIDLLMGNASLVVADSAAVEVGLGTTDFAAGAAAKIQATTISGLTANNLITDISVVDILKLTDLATAKILETNNNGLAGCDLSGLTEDNTLLYRLTFEVSANNDIFTATYHQKDINQVKENLRKLADGKAIVALLFATNPTGNAAEFQPILNHSQTLQEASNLVQQFTPSMAAAAPTLNLQAVGMVTNLVNRQMHNHQPTILQQNTMFSGGVTIAGNNALRGNNYAGASYPRNYYQRGGNYRPYTGSPLTMGHTYTSCRGGQKSSYVRPPTQQPYTPAVAPTTSESWFPSFSMSDFVPSRPAWCGEMNFWGQGVGYGGRQLNKDGFAGYEMNGGGFAAGADQRFGESLFGIAYGYTANHLVSNDVNLFNSDPNKTDLYTHSALAYSRVNFLSRFFATAQVGYTWGEIKGVRDSIIAPVINYETSSTTFVAQAGLGFSFNCTSSLVLTPRVGFNYYKYHQNGYTEAGGDNDVIASYNHDYYEAEGVIDTWCQLSPSFGLIGSFGYKHVFNAEGARLGVTGGGINYFIDGIAPAEDIFIADVGFAWQTTHWLTVGCEFNMRLGNDDYEVYGGTGSVTMKF